MGHQKSTKQVKPVTKTPSLASISTRASSSNSLYDFGVAHSNDERHEAKADAIGLATSAKLSIGRGRLLKFGCAVALVWLWSRYIVRKSWDKRRWGPHVFGTFAGVILSMLGYVLGDAGKQRLINNK